MMLRLSSPAIRRTRRSLSRSRIRAIRDSRAIGRTSRVVPQHLGHRGPGAPGPPASRCRPPRRRASPSRPGRSGAQTNPNGSEGSRSISRCRSRYAPRSGARDIRMRDLEEEHRADRQVGPGEEPMLGGRERPASARAATRPTISPISTGIRTITAFSRIAATRRPRSASIRIVSSFSCHSPRTRRARRSTRRAWCRRAAIDLAILVARSSAPADPAGSVTVDGESRDRGDVLLRRREASGAVGSAAGPRPMAASAAHSRPDSPSRSRSSRASSSRRTARCGGICSRNAVISPISSNAAVDGRPAGVAAVGGRQRGHPLVGRVGQLGAAALEVPQPVGGPGPTVPARRGRGDLAVGRPVQRGDAAPGGARGGSGRAQSGSGPAPRIGRASSRTTRRSRSAACIALAAARGASRRARRDAGRRAGPATPRSRSSSASSQTVGAGGPRRRAGRRRRSAIRGRRAAPRSPWPGATARTGARSARSARRPAPRPAIAGPGRRPRGAAPCRAGGRPGPRPPAARARRAGPRRRGGLLGRLVGLQAVEPARGPSSRPRWHPAGPARVPPVPASAHAAGPRARRPRLTEPAHLFAPGRRHRR